MGKASKHDRILMLIKENHDNAYEYIKEPQAKADQELDRI